MNYYEDFMSKHSDPRVRNWTLMGSPWPTIFIVLAYIPSVLFFLPAYMKNREPYSLKTVIRCYNIFQIVSCSSIVYMIATAGWITGEYSFGCQPVDYTDNPNAVRLVTAFYWIYLLRIIDLMDTIFFILRKKFNQVTPLHVYHHSSSVLLCYICCGFMGGGMLSLQGGINCFIHALMYTYYYLSSLGPKWQKILAPWKPRLTIAQMVQFTILIINSLTMLQPDCTMPKMFLLIWMPNLVMNYKLFWDFYKRTYMKNNKNKLS